MNHNLETAPRLYKEARPGSDYQFSLNLLKKFKALHPDVPTKSGIMVGLGETDEEILATSCSDMRDHDIDMLTIGQYLAPSAPATCPCAVMCTPTPSRCSRPRRMKWALRTPPWVPWCAAATTLTSRRTTF
jgi:lipoate synthase